MKSVALCRTPHQYVERSTGEVRTEALMADKVVRAVYSSLRERAPTVYRLATGRFATSLIAAFRYDTALTSKMADPGAYFSAMGIDPTECVKELREFRTHREVFERKIRYWDLRPMPANKEVVVCPADSRALVGSFEESSQLFVKDKFFSLEELFGDCASDWAGRFRGGEFAVFRLTPDKYHYSHCPVSGVVADIFEVDGRYHSCNPSAVVTEVTPYSKNKRVVTIIDTDVNGGTGVGLVAMVEVVALMIGEVVQRYSRERYESPADVKPGMFLERGSPKSMYRPGSSTDILIFEKGKVMFADDLLRNQRRGDVSSRFSVGFGASLAETDVRVRQKLAQKSCKTITRGGRFC